MRWRHASIHRELQGLSVRADGLAQTTLHQLDVSQDKGDADGVGDVADLPHTRLEIEQGLFGSFQIAARVFGYSQQRVDCVRLI